MENYLNILEESLQKKSTILDHIQEINQKQLALLDNTDMSLETYDAYVDEKSECIEQLTRLDDGFEALYRNIAGQLQDNRQKYREQILRLQNLIQEVTDKSVSVQAMEARNKKKVEEYFRITRKNIQTARLSSKVAINYYQNMSSGGPVDSQFLDKKK